MNASDAVLHSGLQVDDVFQFASTRSSKLLKERAIYFVKLASQSRGPFSVEEMRLLYVSRSIELDSEPWTAKSDKQVKIKELIFPDGNLPERKDLA